MEARTKHWKKMDLVDEGQVVLLKHSMGGWFTSISCKYINVHDLEKTISLQLKQEYIDIF